MSKQASLTTCLARMYEGGNLDSQDKSGPVGQGKKSSGANQSSVVNNLSTMDSKLNLLNEKVDQIVNFQGQVLKKLEDMSQGMGDLEKNIKILKTLKDSDGVVDEKKSDVKYSQHTNCLGDPEMKPLFMELFKLVTSVHQDTAKQKEKLDGIERMVSAVDKVIHLVGETFKNSHIVQFILKGIVPWKKGSLIEPSEANNEVEEKGAKPKHGFSNRGVQVQINREVFEEDNDGEDTQSCGNVQKDEHTNINSVILIEPHETYQFEGGISQHQPPETAARHKDLGHCDFRGAPVMTNKSGSASRKEVSAARREQEVPGESKEYTTCQNFTEDNQKDMIKTSTDNEVYQGQGMEMCQGKETDKIILTVTTGAPEVILAATQSKPDGNCILLLERASDTIQGTPSIPTEKANPGVIATKEIQPATFEGVKEAHKQQKPKGDMRPNILQKTAKGKKPNTAPDARISKLPKPSVTQEKALENNKTQTGQKIEENTQNYQNKIENKCKSDKGDESKDAKELQKARKEPEKITEADSTEITNKEKETKGPIEKPEDYKIIIDDSPPPPAPFNHRMVTTKLIHVTSSYTVHHNEVLGGGRFGQVHKCEEISTGLEFAAKIIKIKGPKEREEVKNEITVMNQLSHVNLIQLYDAFEAKNNVTLIMEYVGGGELFDRIIDENYNLTELDTIIFVKQICEGIHYLHQQYVLHLDLKPENILCVNNTGNQIKIIDFGLARRYKPREKLKINFGTPEFLAPEVVNYDYVSFSTDMWSVGVITYMLLSGLSPFLGDHDTETMNNIINTNWDFDAEGFENVSEEAKEFVSNLLVKEKSSRFSAAQCLKHNWLNNLPEKAKKCRVRLRSQVMLQKYIAQRLWKKNYYAVAAANRFRKINQQSLSKCA